MVADEGKDGASKFAGVPITNISAYLAGRFHDRLAKVDASLGLHVGVFYV